MNRIILQYTFPKMKAPSFFVDSETPDSLQLQYRTRRRGFHFYVQGQVKEIAKMIFQNSGDMTNKLDAKLKKQEIVFDTAVFHFELTFDNKAYTQHLNLIENRRVPSQQISVLCLTRHVVGRRLLCPSGPQFSLKCSLSVSFLR